MKAVIYKIYCKDTNIVDCYVGYNIYYEKYFDFEKYKRTLYNIHNNSNRKVYNIISKNGGFDNWIIEIIEDNDFEDKEQIINKKKYYIEIYNATLNVTYNKSDKKICKEKSNERKKLWLEQNK